MKIMKYLGATLTLVFFLPGLVCAYGDGAATGAVKNGLDSGKVCRCETLDEVRQGQRWHTRPEALKKTAYEFVSSFPDAERNLLDNYKTGTFTKEEVKEILQWLRDNRLYMSDKALKVLNELNDTPEGSATKSTKTTSTGTSTTTTASAPGIKTTPSTPKAKIKQSIKSKTVGLEMIGGKITNLYYDLKEKHPDKNEFALQDMVYRKIFTKEERNVIESDLMLHLRTRTVINDILR
jgi:hypothetical protein